MTTVAKSTALMYAKCVSLVKGGEADVEDEFKDLGKGFVTGGVGEDGEDGLLVIASGSYCSSSYWLGCWFAGGWSYMEGKSYDLDGF